MGIPFTKLLHCILFLEEIESYLNALCKKIPSNTTWEYNKKRPGNTVFFARYIILSTIYIYIYIYIWVIIRICLRSFPNSILGDEMAGGKGWGGECQWLRRWSLRLLSAIAHEM